MPKRIRENEDIYIAPNILGKYRNGRYSAIDERNGSTELDPLDINHKIIIYERQVSEWFLNRASDLIRVDGNGFVVLMICMAYLEGVEQYRCGESSANRNSSSFFIRAIKQLYPNQYNDNELRKLYRQSRCGLFHNGMVGGDMIINNEFACSVEFIGEDIKVNPQKLLRDVKEDFREYINTLMNEDNIEIRSSFDSMFVLI